MVNQTPVLRPYQSISAMSTILPDAGSIANWIYIPFQTGYTFTLTFCITGGWLGSCWRPHVLGDMLHGCTDPGQEQVHARALRRFRLHWGMAGPGTLRTTHCGLTPHLYHWRLLRQ